MSEQELAIPKNVSEVTPPAGSVAEVFRVELRIRLARMTEVARKAGASPSYLEQLRGNSEKILAVVETNIARSREDSSGSASTTIGTPPPRR